MGRLDWLYARCMHGGDVATVILYGGSAAVICVAVQGLELAEVERILQRLWQRCVCGHQRLSAKRHRTNRLPHSPEVLQYAHRDRGEYWVLGTEGAAGPRSMVSWFAVPSVLRYCAVH